MLRRYCSEVESARSRVLELAVTASASVAAGEVAGSPPSRVSKDPIFDGRKTPPPTRIGPGPGSDLDVLVTVDPAVSPGGRLDPALAGQYRQIAADFEADTRYPLHLVIRGSTLTEFQDSVEGAKFVHLP